MLLRSRIARVGCPVGTNEGIRVFVPVRSTFSGHEGEEPNGDLGDKEEVVVVG